MIRVLLITLLLLGLSGCCIPCPLCIPIYVWAFVVFVAILAIFKIRWAVRLLDKHRERISHNKLLSKTIRWIEKWKK